MNTVFNCAPVLALVLSFSFLPVHGQGTFVYDQQSSDENNIAGISIIQSQQPGQSFTPNLSSVGFIRLALQDGNNNNALGATIYLTLRGGSITGAVLGASSPVAMPDNFGGVANFYFPAPVTVTPGVTYYFQPTVQSGDLWLVAAYNSYQYPGGMEFIGSTPFPSNDLWFREGVVPEPSSALLALLGGAVACWHRSKRWRA